MNDKAQIFIGLDSFKEVEQFLTGSFSSCYVLADENTGVHCYPLIRHILPSHHLIQIVPGEERKNLQTCQAIWKRLTEGNADRKSIFINLGGGVIGDMGGFAASCYKRGIPFINIPTTLLAMVDASVGGKTGIDFMGFKNQLGLFSEPEAVFIYTAFLATLPKRELASGFAEVIKHYLIADKKAFNVLCNALPDIRNTTWPEVIKRNIKIKTTIVEQDPLEKGARKALNFGHTIGHAIESFFLQGKAGPLLHGEAVAAGMIAESYLSFKKKLLKAEELEQIQKVLLQYFNLPHIQTSAFTEILDLVKQDKKNDHGTTQFTLLRGIGNYCINNAVEEELITESLNYYNLLLK